MVPAILETHPCSSPKIILTNLSLPADKVFRLRQPPSEPSGNILKELVRAPEQIFDGLCLSSRSLTNSVKSHHSVLIASGPALACSELDANEESQSRGIWIYVIQVGGLAEALGGGSVINAAWTQHTLRKQTKGQTNKALTLDPKTCGLRVLIKLLEIMLDLSSDLSSRPRAARK